MPNLSPARCAGMTYVSDTMSQMTDNTNTPFPDVPWSDWQIDPRDIQIVQRPNGKDWLLGGGAFGQVRRCTVLALCAAALQRLLLCCWSSLSAA